MPEPVFFTTTLLLAWGWLGFFWATGWFVLALVREVIDRRDRAFIKGLPWDELPKAERDRVSQRWRKNRWQGLKHYTVGLFLLGMTWSASIVFLSSMN